MCSDLAELRTDGEHECTDVENESKEMWHRPLCKCVKLLNVLPVKGKNNHSIIPSVTPFTFLICVRSIIYLLHNVV